MNSYTIMIIDDESQMRDLVKTFLEADGYTTIEANDGLNALNILTKTTPDLLIVDVMMPFMDGFTFAKEVKGKYNIPIIFLSAKGEEWDKVKGLKLGGDDYIVKPFLPAELLARVESVLRRANQHTQQLDLIEIGPLIIDQQSHRATADGVTLTLTLKEFGLLELLAKNSGRVFTREQLLDLIWTENPNSSERTVDTHIKTLRLKLGQYGKLIETIWGVGYRFEV
ncbi:response regulator transcription factor [Sporosarcina siberiensis]|uniref:Response regulator transcription factor n=1 Tax=Sporosarcina siberiensis TaxID=1365606 RepID=A0ABW4SEV7_9BACL